MPSVKASEPRPRPLPDEPLDAALARADDRVALILRLATEAGLRRGEIAQVHRDDLTRDLCGWSLLVHGKVFERVSPAIDQAYLGQPEPHLTTNIEPEHPQCNRSAGGRAGAYIRNNRIPPSRNW